MNENLVIGVASKCSLNHALQVPAQPTTISGATQPIIPLPPQWPRSGAVPLLPHAAPHVQTPPGPGATGGTCRGPGATGGTCRGPHAKTEDCVAQPGDCTVGLSMSTEAVGPVAILSPGLSIYAPLGQPTRDRWGDMGCNCGVTEGIFAAMKCGRQACNSSIFFASALCSTAPKGDCVEVPLHGTHLKCSSKHISREHISNTPPL